MTLSHACLALCAHVRYDSCVCMYVLILASFVAQVKDDYMNLVAAACVLVASKQGERPSQVPTDQQLESVTGLQVCALPCPALPCPALPCPAPPRPAPPCPAPPCPVAC